MAWDLPHVVLQLFFLLLLFTAPLEKRLNQLYKSFTYFHLSYYITHMPPWLKKKRRGFQVQLHV